MLHFSLKKTYFELKCDYNEEGSHFYTIDHRIGMLLQLAGIVAQPGARNFHTVLIQNNKSHKAQCFCLP